MNKKFLSVILFSALMVGTAGTFTSCKDYDDDIDQINNELTGIKASISDLQAKVGDGKFVTNVVKNGDGITITWSDNTTSTIGTIKGDKGDKGDAATITIDPVTKNFIINNEDTGICSEGKNGVNGINAKAPSISKETGNWVTYEWDAEKNDYVGTDTGISAMGASTYVVDKTSYWELHVATSENGEGEPAVIKLPKAASITSLKAVSINNGRIGAANVTMSYGKALGADVKFNNVTYKKDAILLSQTSTLSAIVNPQDADATKYAYVLSDSKGNMPFKVTNPVANMTEDALTRAASVNKGVFDMTVEYLSTANCGKSAGTYALTTETADGLVASAYDVKVTEKPVNTIAVTSLKNLSVDINKELDLIGCFKKANVATVNGATVADLTPYIVDYYFEIADKTAAANLGATISGNTIKAEKAGGPLNIKVNYLLVNGTVAEATTAKTITVTFNYVAPSTTLGDVEWTVNKTNADFFLPLGDIQAALAGLTDTDLPSVEKVGSITWADGKALTEKTITVNGVKYGKDGIAFNESWITTIDANTLYVKNSAGQYVPAAGSKIQTPLYIKFHFNYTEAFPAEESYQIVLGLKKANAAVNAFEIPVKVTIKSPAESAVSPFSRLSAYFVGDNAVAYGSANDGINVTYNLFKLYKDMGTEKTNVAFTETLHDINGHTCTPWITTTGVAGDISVKVYDDAPNADNRDNVYSTREIQAAYTVFGNVHIAKIVDKFNLTVKSEIKEGVLEATTAANASGNGVSPIKVSLKNITAKDVYGEAYNLTQMYKKSTNGYVPDATEPMDSRIQSVRVVLADDNAKEYLAIENHSGSQFASTGTDAYSYFSVVKKSAETALQNDVPCKVSLVVLDKWGATTTTTVTITLKK